MTDAAEPAPVVWLAPATPETEHTLAIWARARGIHLTQPQAEAAHRSAYVDADPGVAERVEKQLEAARRALASLDASATERALIDAEREVIAHPSMPQASWLRAEVERGWASRWARIAPTDPERAERAWLRAAALDGGRAPGIGEPGAAGAPKTVNVPLTGAGNADVTLDGASLAFGATSIAVAPGEHAVVVRSRSTGAIAWAGWVSVGDGSRIELPSARPSSCSAGDLALATGIRCPRWITAAPAPRTGFVTVAVCEGDRCGPRVEFGRVDYTPAIAQHGPERSRLPAWLPWTLVAVGVVAATGITLYAAGAFDEPQKETRFVNGGIRTTSWSGSP
jgi:hypothetical protein